ncbi:MAG: hypothetical protein K2N73_06725 [Lachnospiraceae bacterium]|nr:hypothetical protein [Lachnospiraceae bacterium]
MPRAGSGGSRSTGRRSSGGHSSSRTSGGHRVSSGSRARAGGGHSSGFHSSSGTSYHSRGPSFHGAPPPPPPPFGGPGMPPPPPPSYGYRRRRYYRNYSGGSSSGSLSSVIALIIILSVMFALFSVFTAGMSSGRSGRSSIPASTRNRSKLSSGVLFDSNCIVDELGWFDSVYRAGTRLKTFYDKTGVQPYIVLLKYRPELSTDIQKENYAQEYYENHIDNEDTFLYMYFAEKDQDYDVGYMCYVNGKRVDSVMDAEAVDIFWGYIDRYWYDDLSTDALFEQAFTKTAETIMTKSKTPTDIVFVIIAGVVVICIITVITAMVVKRRNEREHAGETQQF